MEKTHKKWYCEKEKDETHNVDREYELISQTSGVCGFDNADADADDDDDKCCCIYHPPAYLLISAVGR